MLSYRNGLAKIGISPGTPVSYKSFPSKPRSLREAIRSTDAPASQDWSEVSDIFRDDFWTDEVQGVIWDGAHWIFSTNANQAKPDVNDKAIYVFPGGKPLGDGKWISKLKYKDVPHPVAGLKESDDHWGQLCLYNGEVYVSHFWSGGPRQGKANVVVFKNNGGHLAYDRWIELDTPKSPTDGRREKAEFQAINPWDGMFYTCFGSGTIHEFFLHDPQSGRFTGRTLKFDIPVTKVQGACFSPNGHLYIASNAKHPKSKRHQTIWYYSALNGHQLGVIGVLAEASEDETEQLEQELEGICYGNVSFANGRTAQIHAVLLENRAVSLDNIFFKSFLSTRPDIV